VEGGQGVMLQNESEIERQIIGLYRTKITQSTFGQLYDFMHSFTADSLEDRSFTRPDTAIQACHTTQKRHMLKPALSNADGPHW